MNSPKSHSFVRRAFSLIEMLVAMALLSVVMLIVMQMLDETQKIWKSSRSAVSEFKDARVAFEAITRRLSQATVNAYWGWDVDVGSGAPTAFVRKSEMHFVSGMAEDLIGDSKLGQRSSHAMFFQAPMGYSLLEEGSQLKYGKLHNLLNGWGYFVEFGTDEKERPKYLNGLANKPKPRARYRLMEFRQPTENLGVFALKLGYKSPGAGSISRKDLYSWFAGAASKPYTVNWSVNFDYESDLGSNWPIAENILALICLPCDTFEDPVLRARLSPDYLYDSMRWQYEPSKGLAKETRNQLPPLVEITMVALDEADFNRYARANDIKDASGDPDLLRKSTARFEDARKYAEDLVLLRNYLSEVVNIDHRIFRATVRMREAKWSGYHPLE